jgi:beta-lactamase regulating signal transducer with metallopeptidase domain
MDTGLRLLLTNAGTAALVACVALLVSRLVRRPALAHALWLLALVKLVTPPILPLPLLPTQSSWANASATRTAPPLVVPMPHGAPGIESPVRPATRVAAAEPAPLPSSAEPLAVAHLNLEPPAPAAQPRDRAASVRAALGAVLAFGALGVLALAAVRFARFRAVLEWAEPAPRRLQARADALAADLGLRRAPPVLVVPARIPPMLWPEPRGPRLLLPQALLGELTEAETDALLAHELAHVRRRDHWVRLVELAATSLFWWYPVTWWTRAALRRAEERCCDEWVLRLLPHSAEAYAQGLLKSLTFVSSSPDPLPALASGASPLYELELRLKEILMSRPAPRLASPVRLALLGAAALGLAVYPTHAREDVPPPAKPAAPATAKPAAPTGAAHRPAVPAPARRPVAASRPAPQALAVSPVAAASSAAPVAATEVEVSAGAVPLAAPAAPASSPVAAAASAAPLVAVTPRAAQAAAAPPPPAPARAATPAPAPPATPAAPSARAEAARRALEDHQRGIQAKRQRLQQEELEIQRQEIELRARMEEAELRAAADAMRAEGRAQEAERFEKRIAFSARRAELDRRRLELDAARLQFEARHSLDERRLAEKISALETQGAFDKAEAERRAVEADVARKQKELEAAGAAIESEMHTLEREAQVHSVTEATDELAQSIAQRAEELEAAVRENGGSPDIEREIQKLQAALAALRPGPTPKP